MKRYQEYLRSMVIINQYDCWIWQGSIGSVKGYGRAKRLNGCQWAHRNSFVAFKRPLKMFEVICHTCDNPSCINPDHLEAGSHSDNNAKSLIIGNRKMPTNLAPPKMGFDGIIKIRELAKTKSVEQIANEFNISKSQVRRVISKESWRNV